MSKLEVPRLRVIWGGLPAVKVPTYTPSGKSPPVTRSLAATVPEIFVNFTTLALDTSCSTCAEAGAKLVVDISPICFSVLILAIKGFEFIE